MAILTEFRRDELFRHLLICMTRLQQSMKGENKYSLAAESVICESSSNDGTYDGPHCILYLNSFNIYRPWNFACRSACRSFLAWRFKSASDNGTSATFGGKKYDFNHGPYW